ncbi:hypothetical protein DS885_13285 [Psychromonas sp. B3M02]|uniref:hypothetical protein n=1 Tax=Psychromonas sp. B3M02 TaxID=2267226 RepID=UPI000DEAF528|nr:hypothetical protein [Psychromonas sp. B3M02]RBW43613.1 hypothetical protein DS885_13285 [Psychromonas sp. B3M02]
MSTTKDKQDPTKKESEEELQAWLDAVHFGSCCSDPLPSNEESKQTKTCSTNAKKNEQDND